MIGVQPRGLGKWRGGAKRDSGRRRQQRTMERSAARRSSAVARHLLPQQQQHQQQLRSPAAGTPAHEFDRPFMFIEVDDDVTLRVVVEGAEDAPLVVLLHGFPQGAPLRPCPDPACCLLPAAGSGAAGPATPCWPPSPRLTPIPSATRRLVPVAQPDRALRRRGLPRRRPRPARVRRLVPAAGGLRLRHPPAVARHHPPRGGVGQRTILPGDARLGMRAGLEHHLALPAAHQGHLR